MLKRLQIIIERLNCPRCGDDEVWCAACVERLAGHLLARRSWIKDLARMWRRWGSNRARTAPARADVSVAAEPKPGVFYIPALHIKHTLNCKAFGCSGIHGCGHDYTEFPGDRCYCFEQLERP